MAKVYLYGTIRTALKIKSMDIEADTVDEMLKTLVNKNNTIQYNELKNSLILLNGKNINEINMIETPLKDGDEVEIFSPVIGG